MHDTLSAPTRRNLLGEVFAAKDSVGIPRAFVSARLNGAGVKTKMRVMVLPGFGANDASTAPLRYYLTQHGFKCEGWGLGLNRGGRGLIKGFSELSDRWQVDDPDRPYNGEAEVPALIDSVHDRVVRQSEKYQAPYAMVGWSLGGFIAREVARDLPDTVKAVVTMGSPVVGGPKYTSIAGLFRRRGVDIDWIEDEINKRYDNPIRQPITAIYSKTDGIVGWTASVDHRSPNVRNIELNSTHFGIGVNAKAWAITLDALLDAARDVSDTQ